MKTDQKISDAIFNGDSKAFSVFIDDNEKLFFAYFRKNFRASDNTIKDVFQETCIELWKQIVEKKKTKEDIKVDLSSYMISIGRNKYFEETRAGIRLERLRKGIPFRRKKKEEEPEDDGKHPLQSQKAQKELDTNINMKLYEETTRPVILPQVTEFEGFTPEQKQEWCYAIENVVRNMEEPCRSILRDTWWNKLSDEEIMNASDGQFPSPGAVRTRRFRCHKKLQTSLRSRYEVLMS